MSDEVGSGADEAQVDDRAVGRRSRSGRQRPPRPRGQLGAALVVAAVVVSGATFLQRGLGPRSAGGVPAGEAPSGAWMCPHGGGDADWQVTLTVANPGPSEVTIRVTELGSKKPSEPAYLTVPPAASLPISVNAEGREASTMVEYFGGWIAAGWVAHAGSGETGVAAEPCLPSAETSWLLPDGITTEETDTGVKNEGYAIIMNPLDSVAVVNVTLYTEDRVIVTSEWSDLVIQPMRSVALSLNDEALGERTVGARVDVSLGRVAAASLGVVLPSGGIRSAVGVAEGPGSVRYLPGADDQGHSDVAVMNVGGGRATLGGDVMLESDAQPAAGLEGASVRQESAGTFPVITDGPSTIVVSATGDEPFVASRRTAGLTSDEGATSGVSGPAAAWVVLPAVAGQPSQPRIALANPGSETTTVTLACLPLPEGSCADPVSMEVPPGRTVLAPQGFVDASSGGAVLGVADNGTFIPAAASYSLGKEGIAAYAVSVGAAIPPQWVPGAEQDG